MTEQPMALKAEQVAELLSCSKAHVHALIRAGELPHVRVGNAVRVPRRKLEEWLEERTVTGRGA